MAPSQLPDIVLSDGEVALVLDIADNAIVEGLLGRPQSAPDVRLLPAALRVHTGVFVTLSVDGELNGCIGSIQGSEPLGLGAARHAWSAAFADPRLPVLQRADYERLMIEVSVLSPLVPMPAASRQQVLDGLRPGVDGLVVAAGGRQAVFLPVVWDQLPDPDAFVDHLQAKAGMWPGSWSRGMRAWRFTATKFARRIGEQPTPSKAA
jgi:AmmeMemoRadiSam system protein A